MKKIMMAVAIAALAVCANAASFTWKTAKTGGAIMGPDGNALASGTAYLFLSSKADTVFTDWVAGTALDSQAYIESSSISAGKIAAKGEATDYAAGDFSAIFATETTVSGQKYLYISGTASGEIPSVGNLQIQFTETATSQGAAKDLASGFNGAGWYTAAVPEPTSGLLMLLGIAGLALRRKRA